VSDDELIAGIRERIGPLKIRGPLPKARVERCENELGFPLPPFLRRLYLEVGDGGFGPGCGLIGIDHSEHEGDETMAISYGEAVEWEGWPQGEWPRKLLFCWDWGCAMWSCVDAATADEEIVHHDSSDGLRTTTYTIRTLLAAWLDGADLFNQLYDQKPSGRRAINPFTRQPMEAPPLLVPKGERWTVQHRDRKKTT
jgi:hypothetical protein